MKPLIRLGLAFAAASGLALAPYGAAAWQAGQAATVKSRWMFCGALDANYSHLYRSNVFITSADDAAVKGAWLGNLAARRQVSNPSRTFCTSGPINTVDAKWAEAASKLSAAGIELVDTPWDGGPGGAPANWDTPRAALASPPGPQMAVTWRAFTGTTTACVARATAMLKSAGYEAVAKTNGTWTTSYAYARSNTVVIHFHCEIPGLYYLTVAGDYRDMGAERDKLVRLFEQEP